MAFIASRPVENESYREVVIPGANQRILGVRLARTIPAGAWEGAVPAGAAGLGLEQGDIKVRPTNVTATIGTLDAATPDPAIEAAGGYDPSYIILHNGPAGGYVQQAEFVAGTYRVNAVVAGIVTV